MLTNLKNGLTAIEIKERIAANQENITTSKLSRSNGQIIFSNLFTLFNAVNLLIAFFICLTGSFNNLMFLGPVVVNVIFGTYQEIKAKRTIDKISLVSQHSVTVLRDGQLNEIAKGKLVKDDLVKITQGQQIPADGIVRQQNGLLVNEAALTGETNSIIKKENTNVLSGSFVVSGWAMIQLTQVGDDSFIQKLSSEVKKEKPSTSVLLKTINSIIKILTYALIPLCLALTLVNYHVNHDFNDAILGTAAAAIGMIPEGLVLLTTLALSAGAIVLSRKKVLVRSLSSIETLARVDLLCLDKTGTITTGNLTIKKILTKSNLNADNIFAIAKSIVEATEDINQTANAIKKISTNSPIISASKAIPFSSEKKYSGIVDEAGNTYLMGALEFIMPDVALETKKEISEFAQAGYRVISIVKNQELLGFILIVDQLRSDAKETFSYLKNQGISLKVISGDNPLTVANVAQQAEISGAENYVNLADFVEGRIDYQELAKEYTVFGRVTPEQKKHLIQAFQEQGHTVGMTGDGVNDVLAMKESNCSIAIAGGSEASESIADFVLLNKDFSSLTSVLNEGRRVINNIERVASLFLIKTMYSVILTIAFIILGTDFPYHPAQLTPINALTVGIPTFFLAMQPDYRAPADRFLKNILEISLPAALNIVFWILAITALALTLNLSFAVSSTLVILAITAVGFNALYIVSWPYNRLKVALFIILIILSVVTFIYGEKIFELQNPFNLSMILFSIPIILLTNPLLQVSRKLLSKLLVKLNIKKEEV